MTRGGLAAALATLAGCASPATPDRPSTGAATATVAVAASIAPTVTAVPDAAPAPDATPPVVRLAFAGDVMFGGFFDGPYVPLAIDATIRWARSRRCSRPTWRAGQRLETPLLEVPPRQAAGKLTFVATPAHRHPGPRRHRGGDLANNHAYDMGAAGTRATRACSPLLGLAVVGAARDDEPLVRAEVVPAGAATVAIVAVTTVANRGGRAGEPRLPLVKPADLAATVAPIVAAATATADHVVVVVHWGVEFTAAPTPWQIEAAHAFVDAGAIAVIGHHPHVLQGIERYRRGVIAYSLGNFVFQNTRPTVRPTGVVRLDVRGRGPTACLAGVALLPAVQRRRPTTIRRRRWAPSSTRSARASCRCRRRRRSPPPGARSTTTSRPPAAATDRGRARRSACAGDASCYQRSSWMRTRSCRRSRWCCAPPR
ncbi:MAG: CapA family protein [Kofleriaceae bacterium]